MTIRSVSQYAAEQATGCRETTPRGQLYLRGGLPVTDTEAAAQFRAGDTIEDPNAGAGSYRNVMARLGFTRVETFETTSSAGDWTLLVEVTPGEWRVAGQENRYPRHGFKYTLDVGRTYVGTFEDVCQELAESC